MLRVPLFSCVRIDKVIQTNIRNREIEVQKIESENFKRFNKNQEENNIIRLVKINDQIRFLIAYLN